MKEFKIRICSEVPEATSETVSGWLDEALKTGASLAADPGGGEAFCNLSLDEGKVAELANRHGCKPNVAVRRWLPAMFRLPLKNFRRKRLARCWLLFCPAKSCRKNCNSRMRTFCRWFAVLIQEWFCFIGRFTGCQS